MGVPLHPKTKNMPKKEKEKENTHTHTEINNDSNKPIHSTLHTCAYIFSIAPTLEC